MSKMSTKVSLPRVWRHQAVSLVPTVVNHQTD